jgi:hypothetical protein
MSGQNLEDLDGEDLTAALIKEKADAIAVFEIYSPNSTKEIAALKEYIRVVENRYAITVVANDAANKAVEAAEELKERNE